MQRKWKSFRDSFRRELANKKKTKSGAGAQTGRKEYIYFQQLMFLLPICETKPEELLSESTSQENPDAESVIATDDTTSRPSSTRPKRIKTVPLSEEQRLFQRLDQNIAQRMSEKKNDDDPDRHFLLSLLPHFKSLPDNMKLDVQMEFFTTIQKYKKAATATIYPVAPVVSHMASHPLQYPQSQPIPTSSQYLHTPQNSSQNTHQQFLNNEVRVFTELQPISLQISSPELNESQSQVPTPLSSDSSIHDFF